MEKQLFHVIFDLNRELRKLESKQTLNSFEEERVLLIAQAIFNLNELKDNYFRETLAREE